LESFYAFLSPVFSCRGSWFDKIYSISLNHPPREERPDGQTTQMVVGYFVSLH